MEAPLRVDCVFHPKYNTHTHTHTHSCMLRASSFEFDMSGVLQDFLYWKFCKPQFVQWAVFCLLPTNVSPVTLDPVYFLISL